MSFLLRLCLGLMVLVPSLAHAKVLEIPGDGAQLSGIGAISGWKCEADGDITVRFDGGNPIVMVYGSERGDTQETPDGRIICGDKDNGFLAIFNWGLLSDGEHTAVAYDNGIEFDRSTFTVVNLGVPRGEDFLRGASGECRVPDFPMPGETTLFEWNQATQHLEAVAREASIDIDACIEALTVESGAMCSGSISLTTPLGDISLSFDFFVDVDGQGCISGGTPVDGCYPASLPAALAEVGVSIMKNTDGSWTIYSLPSIDLELPSGDLGACAVGLTVGTGAMCSGSINFAQQEIGFIFSVDADGRGCVEAEIEIELPCFDTGEEFENLLSLFGVSDASVTKNADGSWTINSFPTAATGLPSGDLGPCTVNLIVGPGAMCDGSIDTPLGDADFTFSVKDDGEGCIEAEVDIPLLDDIEIDECFDTNEALDDALDEIEDLIDTDLGAFATKNDDGSWTITDLF